MDTFIPKLWILCLFYVVTNFLYVFSDLIPAFNGHFFCLKDKIFIPYSAQCPVFRMWAAFSILFILEFCIPCLFHALLFSFYSEIFLLNVFFFRPLRVITTWRTRLWFLVLVNVEYFVSWTHFWCYSRTDENA